MPRCGWWLLGLAAMANGQAHADIRRFPDGPAVLQLSSPDLNDQMQLRLSGILKVNLSLPVPQTEHLVELDPVGIEAENWQRSKQTEPRYETRDGKRTWTFEMELEPLRPGKLKLPTLLVRHGADRDRLRSAQWNDLVIDVVAVVEADSQDVGGMPPLEQLPGTEDPRGIAWIVFLLGGTTVALVAVGLFLRLRGRNVPQLPPHEQALFELAALRAQDAHSHAALDRLSLILRCYLERRLAVPALPMTTEELLQEIHIKSLLAIESVEEMRSLFSACDRLRFAPAPSAQEDFSALIDRAVLFVQQTREAPANSTGRAARES